MRLPTRRWATDTLERVVLTFVEAWAGLMLAASPALPDSAGINLGTVKAAGIAALISALVVLKAAVASRVGDRSSAGLVSLAVAGVEEDTPQEP